MAWNKSIVAAAVLVAAFAVVGCEKKEETLGTKIDKAADKSKEVVKEGAEKTKEAVKEGAEKTKEVAKEGAEKVEEATK